MVLLISTNEAPSSATAEPPAPVAELRANVQPSIDGLAENDAEIPPPASAELPRNTQSVKLTGIPTRCTPPPFAVLTLSMKEQPEIVR